MNVLILLPWELRGKKRHMDIVTRSLWQGQGSIDTDEEVEEEEEEEELLTVVPWEECPACHELCHDAAH